MFRQQHADRIIAAWKAMDEADATSPTYDRAWAVIFAAERNATPEEMAAVKDTIARAPWAKKKRKG